MDKVKTFLKQNWVLVLSLIYILSPIDLIPGDMVTGIGLIDDIVVLAGTSIYAFVKFLLEEKSMNREVVTEVKD